MVSKRACPWTYVEGVVVSGHTHDGLHIIGKGKTPAAVLLEGKDAHGPQGAAFHDANGSDFYNDGSGHGTCFEGDGAAATFKTNPTDTDLYPACRRGQRQRRREPDPGAAAGRHRTGQVPTKQESFWHVHPHPARKGRTPYEG